MSKCVKIVKMISVDTNNTGHCLETLVVCGAKLPCEHHQPDGPQDRAAVIKYMLHVRDSAPGSGEPVDPLERAREGVYRLKHWDFL